MPKFAANLSFMFTDVDFLDRFEAAAKAGFKGVEYLSPFEFDKEELRERLDKHGLTQALFNIHSGDWEGGERGLASLPDRMGEFKDAVGQAIDYAKALNCPAVHALSGIPKNAPPEEVHRTYVENMSFAAKALADAGIKLVIEPVNTYDIPGIFLTGTDQALALMEEIKSDNLFLQYDIYHMQIMEGDLTRTMQRLADKIVHMQIADVPGRHEPGTGEINYPFLFDQIDRMGYQGWIGCEYKPAGETTAGLGWFKPYAAR